MPSIQKIILSLKFNLLNINLMLLFLQTVCGFLLYLILIRFRSIKKFALFVKFMVAMNVVLLTSVKFVKIRLLIPTNKASVLVVCSSRN